jgi:NAD(P)-dependent dehydrogenase (short-subunit alcohol dehydrogenase family)
VRLQNKIAIVTGSGGGLGKAMITRFAHEGATAIVSDINQQSVDAVVRELTAAGKTAVGYKIDVTQPAQLSEFMAAVAAKFGRIDILVNNAGVQRNKPFLQMSNDDWDYVVDVDLKGVFFCIQAVAEIMMKQHYGKIINISSSMGTGTGAVIPGGVTAAGYAIYAAAKAGVNQLTKTMARELGPHGININAIAAGNLGKPMPDSSQTNTERERHIEFKKSLTVMRRSGTLDDIANAAVFLASDESSFISGHILHVDGGRMDRM